MDLFLTAWKNVARNKRRTILNVIALTIGMSFTVLYIGWARGYFTTLYAGMQNFETGNLQVLNDKYLDQEIRLPLDLVVPKYEELRKRLVSLPGIREAAGRIDFMVNLSFRDKTVRTLCRAIDPGPESGVTIIAKNIKEGRYLDAGPGMLIGAPLAKKLGVGVGDTVYVTVRDAYGTENFTDLQVRGIYFFGYPVMDDNLLFMDYRGAASLLGLDDEVTRVVVKLADGFSVEKGLAEIRALLASRQGIAPYSWQTFAQALVKGVQADIGGAAMMIVIIFVLTILNILNSMTMSIRERTREIGTLRAIGMRSRGIVRMFLYEAIVISLIGAAAAVALGGAGAYYLQHVGVDIAPYMPKDMPFPFGQRFHADYRIYDFLVTIAIGVFTAIVGSFRPASRAARIQVADAMRTVQ
jgi:putative ABC transport system permease protein